MTEKKYASRSGLKLEEALYNFNIEVKDKVCLDVGSAVGGFTDCLLHFGAKKVYALEVGKNILEWRLRKNERVIVMEKTNILYLENLPEKMDLITIDVSFTPLKMVLPIVANFLQSGGLVIALLKPHYEAQDTSLLSRGVVKDDFTRKRIVDEFIKWLTQNGWEKQNMLESSVVGEGGNKEYPVLLKLV